eukprot:2388159-Pyramimonas_sp.AAC.1
MCRKDAVVDERSIQTAPLHQPIFAEFSKVTEGKYFRQALQSLKAMPVDPPPSPHIPRQVQSERQQTPRLGCFGLQLRVFPRAHFPQGQPLHWEFCVCAMHPI